MIEFFYRIVLIALMIKSDNHVNISIGFVILHYLNSQILWPLMKLKPEMHCCYLFVLKISDVLHCCSHSVI